MKDDENYEEYDMRDIPPEILNKIQDSIFIEEAKSLKAHRFFNLLGFAIFAAFVIYLFLR